MKRAAICVSGHLRCFKQGYDQIYKDIICNNPNYNFDFFIDTWEKQGWRTDKKFLSTFDIVEDVKKTYNPIKINIEKDILWNPTKYLKHVQDIGWVKKGYGGKRSRGEHILGMFYKIYKCNNLKRNFEKENNFTYDAVIRHRTDFSLNGQISLDSLEDIKNVIYVPHCDTTALQGGIPIRDIFAISSSENIDYYSSLFECFDNLVETFQIFRPEPLLYCHLSVNKRIKIKDLTHSWSIIQET